MKGFSMKITVLCLTILFLASCAVQTNNIPDVITINEDQLIETNSRHPEKIDSLFFELKKQQRLNVKLQEKLVSMNNIMFEKRFSTNGAARGLIMASANNQFKSKILVILTTTDGIPLDFKELSKKGSPSAICEVISEAEDAQLNITWFTGTDQTLRKASADSLRLTKDKILD